jgi:beta-1,4-mannosyltransferase
MMYHASSFARHGYKTTVVGYTDTKPIESLSAPQVMIRGIANPPKRLLRLPWVARAPIRIVWQVLSVLKICLWDPRYHSEWIIVQNPPSIPTLILAQLIARVGGTKLIIDWHNTGYSILAMRTGENHPLCKLAKR